MVRLDANDIRLAPSSGPWPNPLGMRLNTNYFGLASSMWGGLATLDRGEYFPLAHEVLGEIFVSCVSSPLTRMVRLDTRGISNLYLARI